MNFIFDTETTGLPRSSNYLDTKAFDKSRLVSISWILCDENSHIIEKVYYIIKPDNFKITEESINIHGITNEIAEKHGVAIQTIFPKILDTLKRVSTMIAHNIQFDIKILLSELYRYNKEAIMDEVLSKKLYCTMLKGQECMNMKKYPKLAELYQYFYNEPITNAHNAEYDTLHCYKCWCKLENLE